MAALLLQSLPKTAAPIVFGKYLLAIADRAPERLAGEFERFVSRVQEEGLDPIPFIESLASVVVSGREAAVPESARLLRDVATRPPFKDDEHVRQLLGRLGTG